MEELIAEYGPDYEADCEKLMKKIEEYKNRPKPTEMEKLQEIRQRIKDEGPGCSHLMDWVCEYLKEEAGEKPLFKKGVKFDDSSRDIEILCVSNYPDGDDSWRYFCRVTEHENGMTQYYTFYEEEVRFIQLADIKCSQDGLNEKELIIKEIAALCGGVFNPNTLYLPDKEESKLCTKPPKYKAGYEEKQNDGSIWRVLAVSSTPDCFGEWMYFAEYDKI